MSFFLDTLAMNFICNIPYQNERRLLNYLRNLEIKTNLGFFSGKFPIDKLRCGRYFELVEFPNLITKFNKK